MALGCDVDLTDQEPVQDLLRANIAANCDPQRHRARAGVLHWGHDLDAWRDRHDLVVGADLHFAREAGAALLDTLDALVGPGQTLLLATIRRADWEQALFDALDARFGRTLLADAGDVKLRGYVRAT